jgi:hypothetical protein
MGDRYGGGYVVGVTAPNCGDILATAGSSYCASIDVPVIGHYWTEVYSTTLARITSLFGWGEGGWGQSRVGPWLNLVVFFPGEGNISPRIPDFDSSK